ncbi:T9SS type A sorting domain-containing protein [Flaviaesturariibacter aridisoli]|nr:T9SS type A sorting domain-containing protein [Flaviaesturariibacter aridisoli]
MRTRTIQILLGVLCLLATTAGNTQSYGRVVINEYMPWPSASCGTTSIEELAAIDLESSEDGRTFRSEQHWNVGPDAPLRYRTSVRRGAARHFRLRLTASTGRPEYSRVVFTGNEELTLQTYPNPATDRLRIRYKSATEGTARYALIAPDGRTAQSGTVSAHSGLNEWPVDVQALAPAVYQLQVDAGGTVLRTRFVKQ